MDSRFRSMRRKRQELPQDEAMAMLHSSSSAVLAVNGDDGYPYAVPISYVCSGGKIYFHSALSGHKIDSIRRCGKVSLCVIVSDNVVPEEFTTYYKSVIVFGKARIMDDDSEKMAALRLLAKRYSDESVTDEMTAKEIGKGFSHILMVEITIEHITGKAAIELLR